MLDSEEITVFKKADPRVSSPNPMKLPSTPFTKGPLHVCMPMFLCLNFADTQQTISPLLKIHSIICFQTGPGVDIMEASGRASGGARENSVTSSPSSLGAFASLAMLLLCAPPDLQQALHTLSPTSAPSKSPDPSAESQTPTSHAQQLWKH